MTKNETSSRPNKLIRNRAVYISYLIATILLGLAARSEAVHLPPFVAKYLGDALWAGAVFLVVGFIAPRIPNIKVAGIAFGISCLDEFFQLYHAPWIDAIRRNFIGHLFLGDTFAWGDIAAYFIGVLLFMIAEVAFRIQAISKALRG